MDSLGMAVFVMIEISWGKEFFSIVFSASSDIVTHWIYLEYNNDKCRFRSFKLYVDWLERTDSLVFLLALSYLARLSTAQLSAVSCYDDKCSCDYVGYWANCKRVCKCYRRVLLLDAYGHFVCDVWGVLVMKDFCCMDHIESLLWVRQTLFRYHQ